MNSVIAGRTRSRLKADDRRDQLLDVLVQVIRAEGYEQVTMARLAQVAGVNPSLLMHHFGSREKLMLALVDRTLQRYTQLFRQMPQQGSARERLVRVLGLLFSRGWMDTLAAPELFAILALAQRYEDVAVAMSHMYRRYHKVLTQELNFQRQQQCIRCDNPPVAAQMLMALVEGAHYFSGQLQSLADNAEHYGEQLIRHALLMLGAGPLTQDEQRLLNDEPDLPFIQEN
ncbi:MAG: TetR/AcrR family transcriptional regulator [Pseudomonadota bacterium]|nr:TetR/AcrR family transcriptional regulator [Pseudomonadota bacterium]